MTHSTSPLQVIQSKSGHPIPVFNQIYLHSEYDPVKEAKKFADEYDGIIAKNSHLIVYGLGFAYHLTELVNRLIACHGAKARITVVEPNQDLIESFQEHNFPLSKIVSIFSTKDITQLFKQEDFIAAISQKPAVIKHPQSYSIHHTFFDALENFQISQDLKSTRTSLKDFSVRKELGRYSQQSTLQDIYRSTKNHEHWMDHLMASFGEIAYQRENGEVR